MFRPIAVRAAAVVLAVAGVLGTAGRSAAAFNPLITALPNESA